MHLADAALRDPQDLADLGQRQALVVVQGNYDLLAFGQRVDRAGEQVLGLLLLEGRDRILCLSVLQGVAQRQLVAPLPASVKQFIQGNDVDEGHLTEDRMKIFHRDPKLARDLAIGGGTPQSPLQGGVGALDLAGLCRTDRGIQSIARSSSMIAPLIRLIAYVSNLISRARSNFLIASIRPKMPYETRSACSMLGGRPTPTRPATYLTSGE